MAIVVETMVWGFSQGFLCHFFVDFFSMCCKYTGSGMNVARLTEGGLSFNAS